MRDLPPDGALRLGAGAGQELGILARLDAALGLEAAGEAERDLDRPPGAAAADLADDAEARAGADAGGQRAGEAQPDQGADADVELDLARAALLGDRADDFAQDAGRAVRVLEVADPVVREVRELQRLAGDVGDPDPLRHGRPDRGIHGAELVPDFGELVGEPVFEAGELGEVLPDLAAHLEREGVLDFAQRRFVDVHPPGFVAVAGELDLHVVAEDPQRLEDPGEGFARVLDAGAVLHGGRERGARGLDLADERLELRERRRERLDGPDVLRMRRDGPRDGVGDRLVEIVEALPAGDRRLDVRDGLLRRVEHPLGAVQVPVAARADLVVGGEVRALAVAGLQVGADAVPDDVVDRRIALHARRGDRPRTLRTGVGRRVRLLRILQADRRCRQRHRHRTREVADAGRWHG